jgi:hypothetical protein
MPEVTNDLLLNDKPLSPAVAAIRAKLLDGLAEVDVFAEAAGKTPRTVFGWIAAGLPVSYVGRTPYVVVEPAREWLRTKRQRSLEPRGRGRPSKHST